MRNDYGDRRTCPCHGLPRVFKGGHLRCPVTFAASQTRYERSKKGRARASKYDRKRNACRVKVASRRMYMPTREIADFARDLIARRRQEFKVTHAQSR